MPLSAFTVPAALRGGEMTLGVRPEHIHVETSPTEHGIPGKVYVVQPLGSESLIVIHVGDHLVSVRVFGDDVPVLPENVWLVPDFSRSFFYDSDGNLVS